MSDQQQQGYRRTYSSHSRNQEPYSSSTAAGYRASPPEAYKNRNSPSESERYESRSHREGREYREYRDRDQQEYERRSNYRMVQHIPASPLAKSTRWSKPVRHPSSSSNDSLSQPSTRSNSLSNASLDEPAQIFEKEQTGVCSLFKIDVRPGATAYRYDVDVYSHERERKKNLTKSEDEGHKALNKQICSQLMEIAVGKTGNFGDQGLEYVYDNRSNLFTSRKIDMIMSCVTILKEETGKFVQKHTRSNVTSFSVTVTPSATSHVIDLCDLSQYAEVKRNTTRKEDRSVRTFLEMLLSADAIRHGTYDAIGAGSLFENDTSRFVQIGMGMVLRQGVSKGVRIVDNHGRPTPALVVDFKKSPFYSATWLLDSIAEFCPNNKEPAGARDPIFQVIEKYYNGVRLYCSYMMSNHFAFKGFTREPIKDLMVELDGRQMSMVDYFKHKHNLELRYKDFPAVIPITTGKAPKRYFPIELLKVLPNQRVPLEKMSDVLSKALHKENVVRPDVRYKIIQYSIQKMNLTGRNQILEKFGVSLPEAHAGTQVKIGIRNKPEIKMGNVTLKPNEKTKWQGFHRQQGLLKYTKATPLERWAILYPDYLTRESDFHRFAEVLMKFATEKGIPIKKPKLMQFEADNLDMWKKAFDFLANNAAQLVMLVDPRDKKTHGKLKLFECRYKVLTQHLTYEKMMECVNRAPQTLENIVNKLNCKNFGLNYMPIVEPIATKFALDRGDVLVVGYDVCHPPPASIREKRLLNMNDVTKGMSSLEPSIVGITANVAANPHMFVGDFFYQASRKESVDVLELSSRMTWLLRLLEKNRPKHSRPKYIFVVRDGLSEGQFNMAVEEELPALKDGCQDYDERYQPKLVFVIATKRHNKRFFAIQGGRAGNLEPGSVIDGEVTRMDVPEFYMQSHYPIQGTGKATQYGIPYDELDLTQDEIQAFLNMLCYEHQIINAAVSIPEPVYQADELAKRGQDIYRELKNIEPELIPYKNGQLDHRALNQILGYKDSKLESTRFSA